MIVANNLRLAVNCGATTIITTSTTLPSYYYYYYAPPFDARVRTTFGDETLSNYLAHNGNI